MIAVAMLVGLTVVAASALRSAPPRRPEPEAPTTSVQLTSSRHGLTRWRNMPRNVLAATAAAGAALLIDPLLTAAVIAAAFAWPRLRRVHDARRQRRRIDAAWPDAVEMLILVVQAGLTPHQSIVMLADVAPPPTRPGFAEVRRRVQRGSALADALRGLVDELGAGATSAADTLAMAERYGTPIALALEQLAADVRERRRRDAEARARQLPIRMSFPLVICTLPSFVLIAIVPAVLASLSSLTDGRL